MRLLQLLLGLGTPVLLIVSMVVFWRRYEKPPRGSVLESLGWISLWALPPCVLLFGTIVTDLRGLVFVPLAHAIYAGGGTIVWVFEETVGKIYGGRQSTFSHGEYFFALAWVQWLVLITVIYVLRRRGARWRHPALITIGVLVLLNAFVGLSFQWWTT